MPVITNGGSNIIADQNCMKYVLVKNNWADEWTYLRYLIPLSADDPVAPDIGSAEFEYRFGINKFEDMLMMSQFQPERKTEVYVQIRIQIPNEMPEPLPVWTGVILDDDWVVYEGYPRVTGDQRLKAYGIPILFDRILLHQAYVKAHNEEKMLIDHFPGFNRRYGRGRKKFGNRSEEVGPDGVYLFSHEDEPWFPTGIVQYLLEYYSPPGLKEHIQLAGQAEELFDTIGIYEFEGMSMWQALNMLYNRKFGLTFNIWPSLNVEDKNLYLIVTTTTDVEIRAGQSILPANPYQVFFNVAGFPYEHFLGPVSLRFSANNKYDRIKVRGERIKIVAPFSMEDGTLEPAWSEALENEYIAAAGSNDEHENDAYRALDYFDGVYSSFRVPKSWDGYTQNGQGAGEREFTDVQTDASGEIDDGIVPAGMYLNHQKFEQEIPFEVGKDYTFNPPANNQKLRADGGYLPLTVYIFDGFPDIGGIGRTEHETTNRWYMIDKLNESIENVQGGASVGPLDKELGVRLRVHPNRHYIAGPQWHQDNPASTNYDPEFDYREMIVVAMFQGNFRPQLLVDLNLSDPSKAEFSRTLTIDVPGVEYWYATKGVPVDIDAEGDLVYINEENQLLRNDKEKLETVAAYATVWYSRYRQAITLDIKRMGLWLPLGAMLMAVNQGYTVIPIRTPVTRRRLDFERDMVQIETGWGSLDYAFQPQFEPDFRGQGMGSFG